MQIHQPHGEKPHEKGGLDFVSQAGDRRFTVDVVSMPIPKIHT